jgi:hypothetical protein
MLCTGTRSGSSAISRVQLGARSNSPVLLNKFQYKRLFSHLYPSYQFAHPAILGDLMSDLRRGTYQPSAATTVYFSKVSRVLRPFSLLSLNDQVVYQAMANNVRNFHSALLGPVRVGIEATGSKEWFLNLMKSWESNARSVIQRRFGRLSPICLRTIEQLRHNHVT